MNYYEEKAKQTDAELHKGCPVLEPEYTRAHAIAEKVMAQFEAEHFKPILKTLSDSFTEHLWHILQDHLVSDAESNIAGHIRYRIEESVKALLGGNQWALDCYVLGTDWNAPQLRAQLAALIPGPLQEARVKDLEAEVEQLTKDLAREREWHRR